MFIITLVRRLLTENKKVSQFLSTKKGCGRMSESVRGVGGVMSSFFEFLYVFIAWIKVLSKGLRSLLIKFFSCFFLDYFLADVEFGRSVHFLNESQIFQFDCIVCVPIKWSERADLILD